MQNIQNILVLSTGHISEAAYYWLENNADETDLNLPFRVSMHEYGYFLVLKDNESFSHISNSLQDIIAYAYKNNCRYIYLDRDEEIINELPVYEW